MERKWHETHCKYGWYRHRRDRTGHAEQSDSPVTGLSIMLTLLIWIILFVLCWPLAIMALLLYPLFWLLLLPFRILGIAVDGVFEFLRAIVMLPARLLGGR
jgi:hypothetical protein